MLLKRPKNEKCRKEKRRKVRRSIGVSGFLIQETYRRKSDHVCHFYDYEGILFRKYELEYLEI